MNMDGLKIIAVIPAHLASVRFPRKILFPLFGIPMIEHVRRRAKLSLEIEDVVVATCDKEIASVIKNSGGEVVMTSSLHKNGTTRIAEAIENINCSHVILLQGDEPLLNPSYIDEMATRIKKKPDVDSWNATGPLNEIDEIDKASFVKCAVEPNGRILYCFRRGPSFQNFQIQRKYMRKILGLIAFRKVFLSDLVKISPTNIEKAESIEQMRIIESGFCINSVPFKESLPSINEPEDVDVVIRYIKQNKEQQKLLNKIIGVTPDNLSQLS